MQRGARVGHDGFAHVEAFEDFGVGVGYQSDPDLARLDRISFDHLNGEMVNGGAWNRHAATSLGIDVGTGEHADLERRVVGDGNADMAELGGAVDLRRHRAHPSDQVGSIVAADAHGCARIELEHVDGRYFGVEFDLVVDGNAEHRACLRRGRRADDGLDLGEEAGGGGTQRYRCLACSLLSTRLLRRRAQPREFLVVGDHVALADEQVGDLGAFLIGADHGFPARHDEAGDPHQVGETGIGRFCDDHERLTRCFLLFRTRAMLEPVISDPGGGKQNHAERGLEVLGEIHRRINPDLSHGDDLGPLSWPGFVPAFAHTSRYSAAAWARPPKITSAANGAKMMFQPYLAASSIE